MKRKDMKKVRKMLNNERQKEFEEGENKKKNGRC